ncbi:hypothetical protein P280DRAFT_103730 [Massarina eburnea CBS 473.64]|uniref:Uncharacterized protein n=1 Tax=Massarina eburnea CBS 473.64 TaxID=1395130 RepID=A0A6A6RPZ6_9PLEO|nr:hypothetical protein P280DRAFT_103730 [Massarina eburnea CBS 473.64]
MRAAVHPTRLILHHCIVMLRSIESVRASVRASVVGRQDNARYSRELRYSSEMIVDLSSEGVGVGRVMLCAL